MTNHRVIKALPEFCPKWMSYAAFFSLQAPRLPQI
jgi:hypothetical protein